MSKQNSNGLENIVITGIISTTSNKQPEDFKVENPQKTAYLEVDEKNAKLLEKFGLRRYTSNDEKDFFCVKVVNELKLYDDPTSKTSIPLATDVDTPNFKSEGGNIKMSIIKGLKAGNEFFRLHAVLTDEHTSIVPIEADNPFS